MTSSTDGSAVHVKCLHHRVTMPATLGSCCAGRALQGAGAQLPFPPYYSAVVADNSCPLQACTPARSRPALRTLLNPTLTALGVHLARLTHCEARHERKQITPYQKPDAHCMRTLAS